MHNIDIFKTKYIKMFLTVFFVCVAIILAKDQYENRIKKKANYGMEALIEKGEINNLFIGSSLFRQGIDIDVLDQYMNDNYVISYNGAQPVLELWILKHLLQEGVEIKNLYIDMYPYTLTYEIGLEDDKILSELNIKDKWDLYQCVIRPNDKSFASFYHVFVSQNNELLLTWPINGKLINSRFKKGGNTAYSNGMTVDEAEGLSKPDMKDISIKHTQMDAIEQIIMICREKDINVCFIETPKYHTLSEDGSYKDILDQYLEMLDRDGISYYASNEVCPDDMKDAMYYYDLFHLSSEGRTKFTEMLLDYIL